jgi:hypothetical protein
MGVAVGDRLGSTEGTLVGERFEAAPALGAFFVSGNKAAGPLGK